MKYLDQSNIQRQKEQWLPGIWGNGELFCGYVISVQVDEKSAGDSGDGCTTNSVNILICMCAYRYMKGINVNYQWLYLDGRITDNFCFYSYWSLSKSYSKKLIKTKGN